MRLWRSTFVRHVATLVGGQGVAIFVPFLTAPLLGRLYSPADYGALAGYMSIAVVCAAAASLQYTDAVVVQRTERRALGVFAVCIWTSAISSTAVLLLAGLALLIIGNGTVLGASAFWLLTVPLVMFWTGLSSAWAALANRRRHYRLISLVTIAGVASSTLAAIALGILGFHESGLILSYLAPQFVAWAVYLWRYFDTLRVVRRAPRGWVIGVARENQQFPRFGLPANMLRNLSMGTPMYGLAFLGAAELAGHLSRAQALLTVPTGLVAMAIAQVFQQRAVQEMAKSGTFLPSYKRLLLTLSVGAPPVVAGLAFIAPAFFTIYLGPQWESAGVLAQIIAPMICLRIIAGPLWPVFAICKAVRQDFWISFAQFVTSLILIGLVLQFVGDPIWIVVIYSVTSSLVSVAHIVQTYGLSQRMGRRCGGIRYRLA